MGYCLLPRVRGAGRADGISDLLPSELPGHFRWRHGMRPCRSDDTPRSCWERAPKARSEGEAAPHALGRRGCPTVAKRLADDGGAAGVGENARPAMSLSGLCVFGRQAPPGRVPSRVLRREVSTAGESCGFGERCSPFRVPTATPTASVTAKATPTAGYETAEEAATALPATKPGLGPTAGTKRTV